MKFRKKPVIVNATQWHKNGDHPEDHSVMVYPNKNSTTQFEPFLSEGKIVRHCRLPYFNKIVCTYCKTGIFSHGWIDTLEGGHIVCPGDWIITGVEGEYYPCKSDIFEKTYEKID